MLTGVAVVGFAQPAAAGPSGFVGAAKPAKPRIELPPTTGGFDYQLSEAYDLPTGVSVVVRDSTAKPAANVYNICYVNGFQTQPGQLKTWPKKLLLKKKGKLVRDPGWPDEVLLDSTTKTKRKAIAKRLKPVIKRCKTRGFQAVEFDNLDSWTRSKGKLRKSHNAALAKQLVKTAHGYGLAAAQKNTTELGKSAKTSIKFDFAISEQCVRYRECSEYTKLYGASLVFDIEYADDLDLTWEQACARSDRPSRMILRDLELVGPSHRDYVFASCPVR